MRITGIFGLLAMFVLPAAVAAQSEPPPTVGASAYDIGRNGRDKLSLSLKFPVASGGHVFRSQDAQGIAFFGERLGESTLVLRFPVATLVGVDVKRDAEVAAAVGLDGRKAPWVVFNAKSIVPVKDAPNTYRIRGLLALKGIEREVVFEGFVMEMPRVASRETSGFVGDMLYLKLVAKLDPLAFGVEVPKPESKEAAKEQEFNLRIDGFALTNKKPARNRDLAVRAAFFEPEPESRPAEKATDKARRPDEKPTKGS